MTYDVSIAQDLTWVNDPTDPTNVVVCGSNLSQGIDDQLDGDVRYYAGGRVEGWSRNKDARTMSIVLRHLGASDRQQIIDWRGVPVLIRTTEGERFFVFYLDANSQRWLRTTPDDGVGTTTWDVTLSVTRVSFDETLL
jgi:hypothetical protein